MKKYELIDHLQYNLQDSLYLYFASGMFLGHPVLVHAVVNNNKNYYYFSFLNTNNCSNGIIQWRMTL